MFGRLKGAVSGALSKGKGGAAGKTPEQLEEERRAQQEAKEAAEREKQELLQIKLLPWNLADYIKITLFLMIKLPFIFMVGVLATSVEVQVKAGNTANWHRPTFARGPSCFITELNGGITNYNTSLNEIAEMFIGGPIYNESKLRYETNHTFNFSLTESDHCGVIEENCTIDPQVLESANIVEDNGWFGIGRGGIAFGIFPFAFLWMLYKLVWIPLWPVDRIALRFAAGQSPPPQPVFRLVTQPYFQVCTGCLQVVMMILNMLRYVFLPNYLIQPLTSLDVVSNCAKEHVLVHYRMDYIWGQAAYLWLMWDFVSVIIAYAFFKFVFKAKVVGTWTYRLYKAYWLMSTTTVIGLFIANLVSNFNVAFWLGLNFEFTLVFDFNVLFQYKLDLLAWMAAMNYAMEGLSLTYTLGGIVLPLVCGRVPFVKRLFNKEEQATKKDDPEEGTSTDRLPLLADRLPLPGRRGG